MKKLRIILGTFLIAGMLSSCSLFDKIAGDDDKESTSTSTSGSSSEEEEKLTISFNKTSLSLGGGDSETLVVSFNPSTWPNRNLIWESSNEDVAIVTAGRIDAVGMGQCDITATYVKDSSVTATCHVTVTSEYECKGRTNIEQTYNEFSTHSAYGNGGITCPTIGAPKLLVIPVWFTDSSTYVSTSHKADVKSDIQTAFFGSNVETGWRSVNTYYQELSKGTLSSISGTVTDWYEPNKASSYYGTTTSSTNEIVASAVKWYFDNFEDTRKAYDSNNDGYIDSVALIYAYPNYATLDTSNNNLWAYKYNLGSGADKNNPTANVFLWASYDFMYSPEKASERTGYDKGYGKILGSTVVDTHTYIHEFGHVLGLEDYYDYNSTNYKPAGDFSMQDKNIGSHDPYSVMAYGWANPYIPLNDCTLTIEDFQSSHDLILLTPRFNEKNSPFDEYLLLELFTPTGLNEQDCTYNYRVLGPSNPGIRLWHVDARLFKVTSAGATYGGKITTDATSLNVIHYNSNTYGEHNYSSRCEGNNHDFNILQLIRKSLTDTYRPYSELSNSNLFVEGDTFSMSTYWKQFVYGNETKFNNGSAFGWTFHIDSLSSTSATITLTRA